MFNCTAVGLNFISFAGNIEIAYFLENPQEINSFEIDKTGFGTMSAWIAVDEISMINK